MSKEVAVLYGYTPPKMAQYRVQRYSTTLNEWISIFDCADFEESKTVAEEEGDRLLEQTRVIDLFNYEGDGGLDG